MSWNLDEINELSNQQGNIQIGDEMNENLVKNKTYNLCIFEIFVASRYY